MQAPERKKRERDRESEREIYGGGGGGSYHAQSGTAVSPPGEPAQLFAVGLLLKRVTAPTSSALLEGGGSGEEEMEDLMRERERE